MQTTIGSPVRQQVVVRQRVSLSPPALPSATHHCVESAEAMLCEWFEAEVVLTGSGRSALLLCLDHIGLNRYRDRLALPAMMSACVLDAVIRRAFPVDVASVGAADASATLVYHQYGIPQTTEAALAGHVIEDICHALFAGAGRSGARPWRGEAAIFSLPKFLPMNAMAGGIVVREAATAIGLRQLRRSARPHDAARRRQMADVFCRSGAGQATGVEVEHLYLDRLLNPSIDGDELGGVPGSIDELREIGRRRHHVTRRLIEAIPPAWWPGTEWPGLLARSLPYVVPVFAAEPQLQALQAVLAGLGVPDAVYQIDRARNFFSPKCARALLLPCHHMIGESLLEDIAYAVRSAAATCRG